MAHKLADEILKEILTPPLIVPDELFADTGAVSPFSRATYSASDVLLVCKRWMRVATPYLYSTVIVRSTVQAQALARALTKNNEFGRFIKKLRLEGAYADLDTKLSLLAPNITDFCFTLGIYADSKTNGLIKLLDALNPTRVILTLAPQKVIKNKGQAALVQQLCNCIPKWTNLVRVFAFPLPRALTFACRRHFTSPVPRSRCGDGFL